MLAKRVKRAAKRHLDAVQSLLDRPDGHIPPGKPAADKPQGANYKQRRNEANQAKMAQQAAEKAEQERRKADALARLQAGARTATPALTRPALSRPPPLPPSFPPPPPRPTQP